MPQSFNPYLPMGVPRKRQPYYPLEQPPVVEAEKEQLYDSGTQPNYGRDVVEPQVSDLGNKLLQALQPRPVSTGRRILAGIAGGLGGAELAQGITGQTAQNREVEQIGGQFDVASKIAELNRQQTMDESLLGQRSLEADNTRSMIQARENPRPVAPPVPIPGRDVPYSTEVFNQRLAMQPKPAPPQQIPGRDVPLPQGVVDQRVAMDRATAQGRADAKPDKPPISARDVATVRTKLINIKLAKQQLADIKAKFTAGNKAAFGPGGQSWIPTEGGKAFDKSIDRMRQTLTTIMRTPGVGSMSDFETRLQQAQFPNRGDYESVTADNINQLEAMLASLEQGYNEMGGGGETPATAESNEVQVIAPDGTPGTIPRANLQRALQRGYRQAQ